MNIRIGIASFVTLCALAACSSKAVDNDADGSETNDQNLGSGNGDTPVSSDPNAPTSDDGNTGGGADGQPAQCVDGSSGNASSARPCNATYKGLCFETDAEACACAGCELDHCVVLESFPTQVECQADEADACASGFPRNAPNETRRCDFVVNGSCFESGNDACACAGCAPDACLILESYPAQARCQ